VAIIKLIVSLLNLCDAHSIVTETHLNLSNGLHQAVAQFLAKFDAIALFQSFHDFPYNGNPMRALNTTSLKCCLPSTDAIDRQGEMHAC
jgi:hypothetical protein